MFSIVILYLTTFNLIFANEEARVFENIQKDEALTVLSTSHHSRQKRGWGSIFRGTLAGLSWGAYGASIGITLYADITRCKHFKPKPCQQPKCKYVKPCPNTCTVPMENVRILAKQRVEINRKLDVMDKMMTQAFNLEVDGKSANINNKIITDSINKINEQLDNMAIDMMVLDTELSGKIRNMSSAIEDLIIKRRMSLLQLMGTPEYKGIFDKFTLTGTGTFIFSIGLTVGVTVYSSLAKRLAINAIYGQMKTDFAKQFVNQKASINFNQPKLRNKFAYVQGYTTKGINIQLKKSAMAVYNARQATATQKAINNVLTPVINAVFAVVSSLSAYKKIKRCMDFANEMQNYVITMMKEREKVETIMETKVKPLRREVIDKTWGPVLNFLKNETIVKVLESIRNFTAEISKETDDINFFLQHIASADYTNIVFLQQKLLNSLPNIAFRLTCFAERQHAITYTVRDCKIGRDEIHVLYNEAVLKLNLNKGKCIEGRTVNITSQTDVENIISKIAKQEKWYSNCLLNDNDLLSSVCAEKYKGHSTKEIIKQVNKPSLTEDMVGNFLTRCPPRKVSKNDKISMCTLYCNDEATQRIAVTLGFTEVQVHNVIERCVCNIPVSIRTQICALHFCKGENIPSIKQKFKIPEKVVKMVITRKCNKKCVLDNNQKTKVCEIFKCESSSVDTISSLLGLPVSVIQETTPNCHVDISSCVVSEPVKERIMLIHCKYGRNAQQIYDIRYFPLALELIESIIKSRGCPRAV